MAQFTLGLTRLLGHGRAFSEVVAVPNPAVDTGFTYQISQYWKILDSVSFTLVTDANAANRQVTLLVLDGSGAQLAAFPAATVQTAGTTVHYAFLENVSSFLATVGGNSVSPVYSSLLQPGFSVVVTIGSKQAGDQISSIRFNNQNFVTGDEGYLLGVFEEDDPRLLDYVALKAVTA